MADAQSPIASGVQELVARLRGEGVDAGRQEAARILEEARRRAAEILDNANREAAETVGIARATAQAELRAMREALRLAQRDTVLALKEELSALLRDQLHGAVRAQLSEPGGLRAALTAVLGALPSAGSAPAELLLGAQSGPALQGALSQLLEQLLERGVVLRGGAPQAAGVRLRLNGEGIELDFTDESLTELLSARLMARFHALLDGRAP
jgi:V/A-type H+-transporting ATPase subunit E